MECKLYLERRIQKAGTAAIKAAFPTAGFF